MKQILSYKKEYKFTINPMQYWAYKYTDKLTTEEEINQMDATEMFWTSIAWMLKHRQLLNIQILAQVRKGKSTLAITLGKIIAKMMKELNLGDGIFNLNNVTRDQQEFSMKMRDSNLTNTVVTIDELNELEQTGENSTVEQTLLSYFSAVMAARYVHKIACSPKEIVDPNSDIFLEIVTSDESTRIAHCKLYFLVTRGGLEHRQPLGFVNISVADTIKNWKEHVEQIFFKKNKTKEDEQLISEWRAKDFYIDYMVRKHEKMELITKEGIFRPRVLEEAELIEHVINQLIPSAKYGIVDKGIIESLIEREASSRKKILSMYGKADLTQRIMGALNVYKVYFKMQNELTKLDKYLRANKLTPELHKKKSKEIEKIAKTMLEVIQLQNEEIKRFKDINKKYHEQMSK